MDKVFVYTIGKKFVLLLTKNMAVEMNIFFTEDGQIFRFYEEVW